MKKTLLFLSAVFLAVLMLDIQAVKANVQLTVSRDQGVIKLQWTPKVSTPKGFILVRSSINPEPTYPYKAGDKFRKLFSDESVRSYDDEAIDSGKTYYYRVCIVASDNTCGVYSNAVSILIPERTITKGEDYTRDVPKATFNDVTKNDWFYAYVVDFVNRNIIAGFSDGSFRPHQVVNRGDMAQVVANFLTGATKSWDSQVFCDVSISAPFHKAVMKLYDKKIINGFEGGNCDSGMIFKPSKTLNRAEIVKIIMTMYNEDLSDVTGKATGFSDVAADNWFAPFAVKARQKGIINGYKDGSFQPGRTISRVELIKMLAEAEKVYAN